MSMTRIASIIADANARMAQESTRGAEWTFHRVMTQGDRDDFDRWLVKTNHILAMEPGTQERRFISFMCDVHTGRYKGELP